MSIRTALSYVALSAWLTSCAATSLVVEGRSGQPVSLEEVADRTAAMDVVFVGELHTSLAAHRTELELIRWLHERRPQLVISMEMFERDVQPKLDAYLHGEIGEQEFLAACRPWPRYRTDYRPIVEYARLFGLPVLAANIPRELAQQAAKKGVGAVPAGPLRATETTAPHDDYYQSFRQAMEVEKGDQSDWIERYYASQCLKDDTMAESIVDYVRRAHARGERPLVVHLCGNFHIDYGRGTMQRVAERAPDLKLASVTMRGVEPLTVKALVLGDDAAADFVVAVPKPPPSRQQGERPMHGKTAEVAAPTPPAVEKPGETAPTSRPAEKVGEAAPASRPTEKPEPEPAPESGARPALGFMPDYQTVGGVGVGPLRPGGPAERAGMHEGDLIVSLAGVEVADIQDYAEILDMLRIGETADVVVRRDGKEHKLKVVVGSR